MSDIQDTVYTGPGEDISLCCNVSGNPIVVVTWIRNNRHIVGDYYRITIVNNKTQQYFGEYICEASNQMGARRRNIVVVGNHNIN